MSETFDKRHWRKPAFAAALLASTILGVGGFAWAEADAAPTSPTPPLSLPPVVNPAGFSALAAKVKPAIVNIAVAEEDQLTNSPDLKSLPPDIPFNDLLRRFFKQQQSVPVEGLGSGFIVDPAGYIVTNNHVIDHAHKITVTRDDGQSYQAKVLGHDVKTDLALLKIDAGKPLPYVSFGDSAKAQVGDWVVAVGNPFGLGGSVTAGIISAHGRNLNEGPYDDYLQIDAPINPGNSGGPLFDQSGQVIGIDTAIYSPSGGSVGIGFAIPSDIAAPIIAQLREHGRVERAWLGVQMQALTPALARALGRPNTEGVIIDGVEPNSPAAQAALQQGDVITAFDGNAVTSPRELARAVGNAKEGSEAKLSIRRDGHEETAEVMLGQQPQAQEAAAQAEKPTGPAVGLALQRLTPEIRDQLGLKESAKGVYVAGVAPGSAADQAGVQTGDVILRIGNMTVTTPSQAASTIHAAEHEKKASIPLLVMRDGTTSYVALDLAG